MTITPLKFAFQAEELPKKLLSAIETGRTGIWHFKFNSQSKIYYLAVVQGRVIFSSTDSLSWSSVVKVLKRFIYKLRKPEAEEILSKLETGLNDDQQKQIGNLLTNLQNSGIIQHDDVVAASLLNILDNFDNYLFNWTGEAEFIADESLIYTAQLPRFKLEDLLTKITHRRIKWHNLKMFIPSVKYNLILNQEALTNADLTAIQKQQIEQLFRHGKTLEEISFNLAKDTLEIAQIFAKLTTSGIITSQPPLEVQENGKIPQLFIVDDSTILIERFISLVSKWGYQVNYCNNSLKAIEAITKSKPDLAFLDINMPGISGFELIKLMRRQQELTSIPIVMLTGEKSVSNKWRAQWANCKFLTKPSSQDEIVLFRQELRQILNELVPLPSNINPSI